MTSNATHSSSQSSPQRKLTSWCSSTLTKASRESESLTSITGLPGLHRSSRYSHDGTWSEGNADRREFVGYAATVGKTLNRQRDEWSKCNGDLRSWFAGHGWPNEIGWRRLIVGRRESVSLLHCRWRRLLRIAHSSNACLPIHVTHGCEKTVCKTNCSSWGEVGPACKTRSRCQFEPSCD